MAISFAQAKTMIAAITGEDDADTLADITRWLDAAQRDTARARPWPELLKRAYVTLSAPYETGTVTVVNGDATVTLAGGTFPSDVVSASKRFALSYGDVYYPIATRTDDTHIELAQPWAGESDSGLEYVVYKVDYPLESDVDTLEELSLHDHNDGEVVPLPVVPLPVLHRMSRLPEYADRPQGAAFVEQTAAGLKQLRFGPPAPDAAYRVEYLYRKQITEGSFVLSEALIDLVMLRATAEAYKADNYAKYKSEMAEWRSRIEEEWATCKDDSTGELIVGEGRVTGHATEDWPGVNWRSLEI